MKKTCQVFIFVTMYVLSCLTANAQDDAIHVYLNNGNIHSFWRWKLNSIEWEPSFSGYMQKIRTQDSVYTISSASVDSISLGNRELPDCYVEEGLAGWSEVAFCKNGLVAFHKDQDITHNETALLFLPDEEYGIICCYVQFNEDGQPSVMTFNDSGIRFDMGDDNTANLTYIEGDSIVLKVTGVSLSSYGLSKVKRRAWGDDTWPRRLVNLGKVVVGGIGVVAGSTMIAGSLVGEAGTVGLSTPISVIGLISGGATVKGGKDLMMSGLEGLIVPATKSSKGMDNYVGESIKNLVKEVSQDALKSKKTKEFLLNHLPKDAMRYLESPPDSPGWLYWAELGLNSIDALWGETITEADRLKAIYDKGDVITGVSKNITAHAVTLRGYVSPELTYGLDGKDIIVEYGIILKDGEKTVSFQKIDNQHGGLMEFTFDGLKHGTTYRYYAYCRDQTNARMKYGEVKTFKTDVIKPVISDFKVTKSQYKKDGFSHEGRSYDYSFNVSVTATIEDTEGIADWGYAYLDPNGREALVSLRQYGKQYTDTRYAYYRNEAHSTATLYGYVKYQGSDEIVYGEPHDYPLDYAEFSCPDANHPHAIDLGLPSGTKWACCNIGASAPEGYGGYYAWGETSEKSYYSWDNYAYYNSSTGDFISIGSDIAGTGYDVAHVKWGGSWQMPTHDQQVELIDNCTSEWTTVNGVNGRKFTGPNGGTVFLPAAGRRWGCELGYAGAYGFFWSSTQDPSYSYYAYDMYFYSGYAYWYDDYRRLGQSVRAVLRK